MPKLPIDYSKTIIYRISCDELPDFIYIGSTTDFIKRKSQHKFKCKNCEFKLYKTIRENGGWYNWNINIIEQYLDCKNKIEQHIREQEHIDKFKANLNSKNAYITEEQIKNNKVKKIESTKIHRENNRVKINDKKKEYYKNNTELINEKSKIYYEQHKEEIKNYKKEWAEKNKEKIQKYKKEYYEKDKLIF